MADWSDRALNWAQRADVAHDEAFEEDCKDRFPE